MMYGPRGAIPGRVDSALCFFFLFLFFAFDVIYSVLQVTVSQGNKKKQPTKTEKNIHHLMCRKRPADLKKKKQQQKKPKLLNELQNNADKQSFKPPPYTPPNRHKSLRT